LKSKAVERLAGNSDVMKTLRGGGTGGGRTTARDWWMSRNGVGWRKEGTGPGVMTLKDSEELTEDMDRVWMLRSCDGLKKHWGG